jgi:hypothetical protein
MASVRAIGATSEAIRTLLVRAAADPGNPLTYQTIDLFGARQLNSPPLTTTKPVISIYLRRVSMATARRNFPPTVRPDGTLAKRPFPVDLHYLITAWAADASTQQRALGWAIRVIEDTPILPATLLNDGQATAVFQAGETVELSWEPMTEQDESDLWQVAQVQRQPSATYVARTILLESWIDEREAEAVQTRELAMSTRGPDA